MKPQCFWCSRTRDLGFMKYLLSVGFNKEESKPTESCSDGRKIHHNTDKHWENFHKTILKEMLEE